MLRMLWWNLLYAWRRYDDQWWSQMERSARIGRMLIETDDNQVE